MRLASDVESDKIRILISIVRGLCFNASVWDHQRIPDSGIYFTSVREAHVPKKGDLVCCQTSGIHDYTVGFVHEVINNYEIVIREIGSNRLCKMENESFYQIHGLSDHQVWEGVKYEFFRKIVTIINKYGDGWHVYGGIDFLDDEFAEVRIREKFTNVLIPLPKICWNRKRISMKKLWAELEEGYYNAIKQKNQPSQTENSTV